MARSVIYPLSIELKKPIHRIRRGARVCVYIRRENVVSALFFQRSRDYVSFLLDQLPRCYCPADVVNSLNEILERNIILRDELPKPNLINNTTKGN